MSYLVAFDLADDLRHGGCPMCRAMRRVGDRYLRTLLDADISDQRVRERIKRSGGMCREHVLAIIETAIELEDQRGLAVVAEWLLEVAESRLLEQIAAPLGVRRLRRRLTPSPHLWVCPACEAESVIVDSYCRLIVADPVRARRASEAGEVGACLPHALGMLALVTEAPGRRLVITLWRRRAARLRMLLSEFLQGANVSSGEPSDPAVRTVSVDAAEWVASVSRRQSATRPPS